MAVDSTPPQFSINQWSHQQAAEANGLEFYSGDSPTAQAFISKGLYVGTGGDVHIVAPSMKLDATEVIYKNVSDGTFLPVNVVSISPASTADDFVVGNS